MRVGRAAVSASGVSSCAIRTLRDNKNQSVVALLSIPPRISSRTVSVMILVVRQKWRLQNNLTHEQICSACINSRCCSWQTLREVTCEACCPSRRSAVKVTATMRCPILVGDSIEQYKFEVKGICTSSRVHLCVPSACLVAQFNNEIVVSSPFEIMSRALPEHKARQLVELEVASFLNSSNQPQERCPEGAEEPLQPPAITSPDVLPPNATTPSQQLTSCNNFGYCTQQSQCNSGIQLINDSSFISSGITVVVRLVSFAPQFTADMGALNHTHYSSLVSNPTGLLSLKTVELPSLPSVFRISKETTPRCKVVVSAYSTADHAEKGNQRYSDYLRNQNPKNVFNLDLESLGLVVCLARFSNL
ncbi:hypothetical protein Pelo_14304 [Pelomyxa schiedti]|nr:hypothetical protein Pelo_14304 [Pelomyxa schiedti]